MCDSLAERERKGIGSIGALVFGISFAKCWLIPLGFSLDDRARSPYVKLRAKCPPWFGNFCAAAASASGFASYLFGYVSAPGPVAPSRIGIDGPVLPSTTARDQLALYVHDISICWEWHSCSASFLRGLLDLHSPRALDQKLVEGRSNFPFDMVCRGRCLRHALLAENSAGRPSTPADRCAGFFFFPS